MKEHVHELNELLQDTITIVRSVPTEELKLKSNPSKWSRQEILGHLIDSAVNNLQRFTECQPNESPFHVANYKQDLLVASNGYQQAETEEVLNFWMAINRRIGAVMLLKSEEELSQPVLLPQGGIKDLKFLMTDYIEHMKYHLSQITGKAYSNSFDSANYIK